MNILPLSRVHRYTISRPIHYQDDQGQPRLIRRKKKSQTKYCEVIFSITCGPIPTNSAAQAGVPITAKHVHEAQHDKHER